MVKDIDKSELPFLVDLDIEGNVVLSSKKTESDTDSSIDEKEEAIFVRLIGFNPETLNEFSQTEIDEDLYDITNFTKAVSERLKSQKAE